MNVAEMEDDEIDNISPEDSLIRLSPGPRDWRMFNVILLGLTFMLMFSAFQTCAMVEQRIIAKKASSSQHFSGSGYVSLAIIYGMLSVSNWAAPAVISIIGAKSSMIVGSISYLIFILSFLWLQTWLLYLASALVGIGGALLWTAQGNLLSINSDEHTAGRNSGIFWALFQGSLVFGNLYSYLMLRGSHAIADSVQINLFTGLTAACVAGIAGLFFICPVPGQQSGGDPVSALRKSVLLFRSKDMLMLCLTFAYTGVVLTFFSGVYGTCLSQTKHFGISANGLIGLSGMLIGIGETTGGLLFGIFGKDKLLRREVIVFIGFFTHAVTFYLIFLFLPADSPLESTTRPSYVTPTVPLALTCAFLLGFGDSCFNTQIYCLLGIKYQKEENAPAFAIFKFVQSLGAATAFVLSTVLLLHWQLLILALMSGAGAICFISIGGSGSNQLSALTNY